MTSEFLPPIIRHYIDLPREMSDRLHDAAREQRTSKKRIMEGLVIKYLQERDSKRGKK